MIVFFHLLYYFGNIIWDKFKPKFPEIDDRDDENELKEQGNQTLHQSKEISFTTKINNNITYDDQFRTIKSLNSDVSFEELNSEPTTIDGYSSDIIQSTIEPADKITATNVYESYENSLIKNSSLRINPIEDNFIKQEVVHSSSVNVLKNNFDELISEPNIDGNSSDISHSTIKQADSIIESNVNDSYENFLIQHSSPRINPIEQETRTVDILKNNINVDKEIDSPISDDDDGSDVHLPFSVYDVLDQRLTFVPPLSVQRYEAVVNVIQSDQHMDNIHTVAEFGCAEFHMLKYYKEITNVNTVLFIDIDEHLLVHRSDRVHPLSADYLDEKTKPFKVVLYNGDVSVPDKRFDNVDVVIAIELIEHLYPPTLNIVPYNIFGVIQPYLVIVTTPNGEFNVLFENYVEGTFRHDDHKFEWTRQQFTSWAENIVLQYPMYSLKISGIGPPPRGESVDKYGHCSQMAVFTRKSNYSKKIIEDLPESYKFIKEVIYPIKKPDTRTEEQILFDEIDYVLHIWQEDQVPLNRLYGRVNKWCGSVEELRILLEKNCRQVIYNKENSEYYLVDLSRNNYSSSSDDEEEDQDELNQENESDPNSRPRVVEVDDESWDAANDSIITNDEVSGQLYQTENKEVVGDYINVDKLNERENKTGVCDFTNVEKDEWNPSENKTGFDEITNLEKDFTKQWNKQLPMNKTLVDDFIKVEKDFSNQWYQSENKTVVDDLLKDEKAVKVNNNLHLVSEDFGKEEDNNPENENKKSLIQDNEKELENENIMNDYIDNNKKEEIFDQNEIVTENVDLLTIETQSSSDKNRKRNNLKGGEIEKTNKDQTTSTIIEEINEKMENLCLNSPQKLNRTTDWVNQVQTKNKIKNDATRFENNLSMHNKSNEDIGKILKENTDKLSSNRSKENIDSCTNNLAAFDKCEENIGKILQDNTNLDKKSGFKENLPNMSETNQNSNRTIGSSTTIQKTLNKSVENFEKIFQDNNNLDKKSSYKESASYSETNQNVASTLTNQKTLNKSVENIEEKTNKNNNASIHSSNDDEEYLSCVETLSYVTASENSILDVLDDTMSEYYSVRSGDTNYDTASEYQDNTSYYSDSSDDTIVESDNDVTFHYQDDSND